MSDSGLMPSLLDLLEQGLSRSEALKWIETQYRRLMGISPKASSGLLEDPTGETIVVDIEGLARLMSKDEGCEQYLHLVRSTIEDPYEIWLTVFQNNLGAIKIMRVYVKLWALPPDKKQGTIVMADSHCAQYRLFDMTAVETGNLNKWRTGQVLYAKDR